jgi:photosystem II stability/assembly factor-like uncharacterized protein
MHRNSSFFPRVVIIIALLLLSACNAAQPASMDSDAPQANSESDVLHIEEGAFVDHGGEWADFLLKISVRREGDGALGIAFHANAEQGAYILVMQQNGFSLQRESEGQVQEVAVFELDLQPVEWHILELEMLGGEIRAFYFGEMVVEYVDTDPLPPGGLSFETMDGLSVDLQHINVEAMGEQSILVEEQPQPTEIAPSQPEQLAEQPEELTGQQDSTEWEWVRLGGPPGGTGYDIRYNFDNPNIWYTTDANSGVHISNDNGLTWEESNSGLPGQSGPTADAKGVFCLTVDPHDPQIIWIGTISKGHIYRSTDGGKSWVQRDNGIEMEYDQLSFRGFTVDPRSSDIVYAMGETNDESLGGPKPWEGGAGGVVYRTTDAGENWVKIWDGGMPSSLARYLWIDPRDPDVLYVSTGIFDRSSVGENVSKDDPFGGLGILKSTDGGDTWRVLNKANGLRNLYIGSLFMHPDDPDILLAAAGHGGDADAAQWLLQLMNSGQPSTLGVYRTVDGGETWVQTLAANELEIFSSVELCPSDANMGYAATRISMYRTKDAGVTWELTASPWSPPGVSAGFPIDMQCDPNNVDRVFVNNYGGGNYLSEDGGKTWTHASIGYTGAQVFGIDFDPDYPARIYVMTFSGLWRSDDAGVTWNGIRFGPEGFDAYRTITVDPNDSSHVFSGQFGFIESQDAGASWTVNWDMSGLYSGDFTFESTLGGTPSIVYAPSDSNRLYVGFSYELCALYQEIGCMNDYSYVGPGFMVSRNGGTSWEIAVDAGLKGRDIRYVAVDPADADLVYVATDLGIYASQNAGGNWVELPAPSQPASAYAVAVDPSNSSRLLVSIDRDGVYLSEDGGQTWKSSSAGMEPNASVSAIAFDPANSRVVYVSDLLSGVYRSQDSGATWTRINNGLKSRAIADIVISANGNHLYAGSNDDGMYRLDLNGVPPVH